MTNCWSSSSRVTDGDDILAASIIKIFFFVCLYLLNSQCTSHTQHINTHTSKETKLFLSKWRPTQHQQREQPHWTEILERLMLRSEDDPIDIMFSFPVAFSQVYRSGDGSSGSGIVAMRGSPWVGRKSRDNDTFFAYWLPLQFCAFLFSFLIHSKPPIRFLLSLGHSSLFVDPSSYIGSSSLRSILFSLQSFI